MDLQNLAKSAIDEVAQNKDIEGLAQNAKSVNSSAFSSGANVGANSLSAANSASNFENSANSGGNGLSSISNQGISNSQNGANSANSQKNSQNSFAKNGANSGANPQNSANSQASSSPEIIDFMPSYKAPSELQVGTSYTPSTAEAAFLQNVKERILVLFEGLKAAEYEDIETRLDLTINFLEFLLASIEDKLKK